MDGILNPFQFSNVFHQRVKCGSRHHLYLFDKMLVLTVSRKGKRTRISSIILSEGREVHCEVHIVVFSLRRHQYDRQQEPTKINKYKESPNRLSPSFFVEKNWTRTISHILKLFVTFELLEHILNDFGTQLAYAYDYHIYFKTKNCSK